MSQNPNLAALGEEKINKLMLRFSLPCIMSLLVSSLYNIVDQIFIGNSELSTLGNAATGVVFPIFIMAQAFAWCFGDGCAAYLSICQGENDTKNVHKAIGSSISVSFLCGLMMIALVLPFKEPILTFFGASQNTLDYAIEYLYIVLPMMPIFILCNMMNSVIRADGSPSWAMAAMLAGAITNLILDPVFIFAMRMGMTGAALATVIGQAVTFLITLIYFFNTKTFKLKIKSFIPKFSAVNKIVQLGISTFFTQVAIVVVAILCNVQLAKYGALSKYGADIPIAIIGIQSKIFTIVVNLVVGIALGCQPIISFNMGAKKYGRVKELYRKIMGCTLLIGAVFTLIFEIAPDFVIGLFGTPSNIPNPEAYWEFGRKTMRIFLSLVSISCLIKMNSIFFQAVGKPVHAVIASMVRDIVCFTPLILVLPTIFNSVDVILYAAPMSDFIAMLVTAFLSVSFIKSLRASDTTETVDPILKPSTKGVVITIAREHGSAGNQIGRLVAEKLGIPFYYKEMIALAAKECGFDQEFISDINEKAPAILHNLYLNSEVVQRALVAQEKAIKMIAEQGSCVIVGRGADYILRDSEDLLRIFIYAPENYRIKRIMESYGDSYEDAKKHLKHSDEVRAAYYKQVSGLAWGVKQNYDLMVNSSIGIEESANYICSYIKMRQSIEKQ